MPNAFDVTYKTCDIEVVPAALLGGGKAIRFTLETPFAPAALMISTAVAYMVLVRLVFPALRPAEGAAGQAARARLGRLRDVHNVILFLFSLACCGSTAIWLWSDGQLGDWNALLCKPVEGTWLRGLSTLFTLSKLWEWGDTAFLVMLGSRPAQFLHLYHHATTFWLFCFVMNMPGPEKFGLLMNGGVHTLMYSHYWRSWPKPLVPLITILQIAQLAAVTYTWSVSPAQCPKLAFANGPSQHPLEFVTPYAMVPVYLFFFVLFFLKRFVFRRPKKTADKLRTE